MMHFIDFVAIPIGTVFLVGLGLGLLLGLIVDAAVEGSTLAD